MENTNIDQIITKYKPEIKQTKNSKQLEKIRVKLLGRQGLINDLTSQIPNLPPEERGEYGQKINKIKQQLEKLIADQQNKVKKKTTKKKKQEVFQLAKFGHLHPITVTERKLNKLFKDLGFSIYDGPEIETDEYCFERLNVPKNHPARDMQDTIYIQEPEYLLRTQTSSIESRLLENEQPPFKAVFPGQVYRNEKVNKSNHFIFHHYQGVAVNKDITLKDLIGTLDVLFKNIYGQEAVVRYRCKYYPEVEPGLGMDLQCYSCQGKGCKLCKGIGWIEMGGAGIIHPTVLEKAGIDHHQWRGFAFGLGLDRWVMAKYNIDDIRTLLGGNLAYKPN
jgi:phenylalanyl-tRNA synthetase alpha chain